jgi:hypothetical protein
MGGLDDGVRDKGLEKKYDGRSVKSGRLGFEIEGSGDESIRVQSRH